MKRLGTGLYAPNNLGQISRGVLPAPAGSTRLLLDNFVEAAEETNVNLHTPDEDFVGGGWGSGGGAPMRIIGATNQLHGVTNESAIIDVGVIEKDFEFQLDQAGTDYICPAWRIVDEANWVGMLADDDGYWIYKEIAGSLVEIDSVKIPFTAPAVLRVTVNTAGEYNTYVEGVWKNGGTVNELIGNTNVGFMIYSSGGDGQKLIDTCNAYELGTRPEA